MLSQHTAYFQETEKGESRWWSWLIGFWFIVIGWIIAQLVITGPIPDIVAETRPDLVDELNATMNNMASDIDSAGVALTILAAAIFTLLTPVFWMINRFTKGTLQKIFGWLTGIAAIISTYAGFKFFKQFNDPEANGLFLEMMGVSPIAYALMLLSFPGTLVGVFLVQKFIHKRTITSLHTAAQSIDWKRIFYAIGVTWLVFGVVTLILHVTGISPVKSTFDPSRFFAFALATILFIPLQSATEEIIFRGYLNQGFGHFIKNKWVVFFITSALFASMHLANPESQSGAEQGGLMHLIVMSHYFMFGFILSLIVYFEDGLEAAIGVHAGNNMFAAMFVNYEGSVLPTPSMFLATPNMSVDIPIGIATLGLICWLLYRSRNTDIALTA